MMDTKRCSNCTRALSLAHFAPRTRRDRGDRVSLQPACVQCEQARCARVWAARKRRAGEWQGCPPSAAEAATRELMVAANRWRYPVEGGAQLRQAVR